MTWWENLESKVILREPLKKHTTFKVGGPAQFFITPKGVSDLRKILALAKRIKLPVLILGAGSNVLASDKVIKAVIIKLSLPYFKKIDFIKNRLCAGSGTPLSSLIRKAKNKGLSGLEFLAGIPGTLGGALAMNAGFGNKNIGDLVEKVTIMDYNGKIITLSRGRIKFSYRKSGLDKYVILGAVLKLTKKNRLEIQEDISRSIKYRWDTQDRSFPNAGCVFKNPLGESAGKLIDLCGLKGKRIAGASISLRHANFILNSGHAKAGDILRLMRLIQKKVKDKFNIKLEPEIKIWI